MTTRPSCGSRAPTSRPAIGATPRRPPRPSTRRASTRSATRCASPIRTICHKGFVFDGRVSEDFKLSTGTWVNFAAVRAAVIGACAPLIRDVVLTGLDRNFIGAHDLPGSRGLRARMRVCRRAPMRRRCSRIRRCGRSSKDACGARAKRATGSSNHVARALVMAAPPDIDKGEVTDKGSINQRAVRTARPIWLQALYAEHARARCLRSAARGAGS